MVQLLESIDWYGFLSRPPLPSPSIVDSFAREPILVTGAGGSIGSALVLRLAAAHAPLVLLESSESSLFDLQSALASSSPAYAPDFYLGSVADGPLVGEIFARHQPRLVFHAAAFKHVPLLEEQPFAAIANNVKATQILVAAASAHGARVLLLSTDKAVAPASLMGATKRVAEQIVLAAGGTVLRLGNVLGSRGSVTEVFARQIASGAPLTVTDPAARRYFLTIPEAVDLLLSASAESHSPALFVPHLDLTHYIADLARFMSGVLAPAQKILIEFTRLRAGDKESEALYSSLELPQPSRANGLISVESPQLPANSLRELLDTLNERTESRDLGASLSIIRRLVPDYTPSKVVEALPTPVQPPVHNV